MRIRFSCSALLLPLMFVIGCASSYHSYPCGTVDCGYCPPKPLPYSAYDSCSCSDSIGQVYLAELAIRTQVENSVAAPPGYTPAFPEKSSESEQ